jgi:hypothetical protein
MTFAPPTASGIATRRLGLANGLLWIVAAIVLVVVGATSAYAFVVNPYTPGGGLFDPPGYPWQAENPLEAEEVAPNEWAADASAVIRIPAAELTVPLRASIVRGDDLDLYRTAPEDLGATGADRPWPEYFDYLYGDRDVLLVPTGDDLELWVGAGGAWQLRLAPVTDLVTIDDDYDGRGNAVILYTGDAVSARFQHIGDGVFFVGVYTAYDRDGGAIIDSGDVNQRISWAPDSWVLFEIESDADRGAWSIDIEQLAPSTPSPTSTPPPTPQPTETDG